MKQWRSIIGYTTRFSNQASSFIGLPINNIHFKVKHLAEDSCNSETWTTNKWSGQWHGKCRLAALPAPITSFTKMHRSSGTNVNRLSTGVGRFKTSPKKEPSGEWHVWMRNWPSDNEAQCIRKLPNILLHLCSRKLCLPRYSNWLTALDRLELSQRLTYHGKNDSNLIGYTQ